MTNCLMFSRGDSLSLPSAAGTQHAQQAPPAKAIILVRGRFVDHRVDLGINPTIDAAWTYLKTCACFLALVTPFACGGCERAKVSRGAPV